MWSIVLSIAQYLGLVVLYPILNLIWVIASAFLMMLCVGGCTSAWWYSTALFYWIGDTVKQISYRALPMIIVPIYAIVFSFINVFTAVVVFVLRQAHLISAELDRGDRFDWYRILRNRAIIPDAHQMQNHPHWSDTIVRILMRPLQNIDIGPSGRTPAPPPTEASTAESNPPRRKQQIVPPPSSPHRPPLVK